MATSTGYDILLNTSHLYQSVTCRMHKKHCSRRMSLVDCFNKKVAIFFRRSFHKKPTTNSCFSVGCRVLLYTLLSSTTLRPHVAALTAPRRVVHVAELVLLQPQLRDDVRPICVLAGNQTHCIRLC